MRSNFIARAFFCLASSLLMVCVVNADVPGWPAELSGEDVVIRFSNQSEDPEGVIVLKGKSYNFYGDIEDDRTLSCTYETADDDFDFTLTRDESGQVVFRTGKLTRTLQAAGEQPAPETDGENPPEKPEANRPPPSTPQSDESQMNQATPRGAIVYTPRTIKDSTSQLDVANILVPKGWEVQSNIEWRPLHASFIANRSTVYDPASGWALQYLPLDKLLCLPSAYQQAVQQNDLLTPSGMELCGTVPTAEQYASGVLIARYRNVPGLKIHSAEQLPKVAQALRDTNAEQIRASAQNGYSHHFDAAKVRISYAHPTLKIEMEEDVYCLLEITWSDQLNQMAIQNGMPNTQTWTIQPVLVYSFIAPKGQLDRATPILQTIVSSGQLTLRWVAYTSEIARKIREINTRDLAAMAATQSQITETQRATWRDMTDRQNKINLNTGIQLTGHQVYADPNQPDGPKYILDLNYTHYVNDDGSIFSTPESSATPPGSGWREMKTVYPD